MSCFLPLAIQSFNQKWGTPLPLFLHYFSGCSACCYTHTHSVALKFPPPQYWAHKYLAELYLQRQTQAQSFEICIITEFNGPCQTTPQIGELWSSFPSRSLGPWLVLLTAHLHICSAAAAWENSRKAYWFFLYASFLLSKDVWKRKKWSWPMFLPLETNQHLD